MNSCVKVYFGRGCTDVGFGLEAVLVRGNEKIGGRNRLERSYMNDCSIDRAVEVGL